MSLAFVKLNGFHDYETAVRPVWVNPERVAYLAARLRRSDGEIIGTRIYFAEDGTVDVEELPEQVVAVFADQILTVR